MIEPVESATPPAMSRSDHADTAETVRALRAEVTELRRAVAERDEALARLGERLMPVERAREEGAAAERARRVAAERELEALRATKLFRYTTGPRDAWARWRARRGRDAT